MIFFTCMICNEPSDYPNVNSVNFLCNDEKNTGLPICKGCIPLVNHLEQYNYLSKMFEKKRNRIDNREKKKIGIELFL